MKKFLPKRSRKNRLGRIKEIPKGKYCYTAISYDEEAGRLYTKVCPFWKRKNENLVKCSLLGIKSRGQDPNLIWDQVKICGINDEYIINYHL